MRIFISNHDQLPGSIRQSCTVERNTPAIGGHDRCSLKLIVEFLACRNNSNLVLGASRGGSRFPLNGMVTTKPNITSIFDENPIPTECAGRTNRTAKLDMFRT